MATGGNIYTMAEGVWPKQETNGAILVIGPRASSFAAALRNLGQDRAIRHATTRAEILDHIQKGQYEHILADDRDDGPIGLVVAQLAALNRFNITVLAGPASAQTLATLPTVDTVIKAPYNPHRIAIALGLMDERRSNDRPFVSVDQSATAEPSTQAVDQPDKVAASAETATIETQPSNQEPSAEADADNQTAPATNKEIFGEDAPEAAANAIGRFFGTLFSLIPGLTPILSTIYKHLALVTLSALLVAFVSYGIMIAFFLLASGWSAPIQLSEGHAAVEKAQRDLTDMEVRRNYLSQQVAEANREVADAREALDRSSTLSSFVTGTISSEIQSRQQRVVEIDNKIVTLNEILDEFGKRSDREKSLTRLREDYRKRLISRDAYDNARLAFINTEHRIAGFFSELSGIQLEHSQLKRSIIYLRELLDNMETGAPITNVVGGADLVPINNQVIEIRQVRSNAESVLSSLSEKRDPLAKSLSRLERSIKRLSISPLVRANDAPVTALFVPYDNLHNYEAGEPLYACFFQIIFCSKVGEVKTVIPGEVDINHPFFGKPVRGQFVEAELTDETAAREGFLHVGRPPLFF